MEFGCEVEIQDRFGAFEHFYETSDVDGVGSKHYVANAFIVDPSRTLRNRTINTGSSVSSCRCSTTMISIPTSIGRE
jgi:hypothetical protein